MLIFLIVVILGLSFVGWLIFQESRKGKNQAVTANLLDRLAPTPVNPPLEKAPLESFSPNFTVPAAGGPSSSFEPVPSTQDIPAPLPIQSAGDIQKTMDLEIELHELKEKYERLDQLFKEKSEELDRKDTALNNELKTKKEFNKVKDILEKEIKDTKDSVHKFGLELTASHADIEAHKKKVSQLEEKLKTTEQEARQKEIEANDFNKQFQSANSSLQAKAQEIQKKENEISELNKKLQSLSSDLQETRKKILEQVQINQSDAPSASEQKTETPPENSAVPISSSRDAQPETPAQINPEPLPDPVNTENPLPVPEIKPTSPDNDTESPPAQINPEPPPQSPEIKPKNSNGEPNTPNP